MNLLGILLLALAAWLVLAVPLALLLGRCIAFGQRNVASPAPRAGEATEVERERIAA